MSLPHETKFVCKGCGAEQPFTAWKSLNVTLDPEEKEKLLKGELTRFTCKQCNWSGQMAYPMLYHDMEKQLMAWLWTDAGQPDLKSLPPAELMKDYRLRITANFNELVEKIIICDHGLDDRVIEYFKMMLYVRAEQDGKPLGGKLFFDRLGKDAAGQESIEFALVNNQGGQLLTVSAEFYHKLATMLAPKLSAAAAPEPWLRIDQAYAQSLIS